MDVNQPKFLYLDSVLFISILSTMLYITGWSYALNYYNNFHIGLLELSIAKEFYFLYSFIVIYSQWHIIIILLLLPFFAIFIKNYLIHSI